MSCDPFTLRHAIIIYTQGASIVWGNDTLRYRNFGAEVDKNKLPSSYCTDLCPKCCKIGELKTLHPPPLSARGGKGVSLSPSLAPPLSSPKSLSPPLFSLPQYILRPEIVFEWVCKIPDFLKPHGISDCRRHPPRRQLPPETTPTVNTPRS